MNNLFLLNEALNAPTIADFEVGIANLNSILVERNGDTDTLMKHDTVYFHNNGFGTIIDFYSDIVSPETQRLIPRFIESLKSYSNYISTDLQFDGLFPNDCNAFSGISFTGTVIPLARQVTNSVSFKSFKNTCAGALAQVYIDIQGFWNVRGTLFPNLVFCDEVWDQIQHLSLTDARFNLIKEKLKRLNAFTSSWVDGGFDYKSCGLNCSPDTPTRIEATKELRTFTCTGIGNKVFSLHAKWYFGSEPFRLYFHPEASNHKVYVGYIGDKNDIGFS